MLWTGAFQPIIAFSGLIQIERPSEWPLKEGYLEELKNVSEDYVVGYVMASVYLTLGRACLQTVKKIQRDPNFSLGLKSQLWIDGTQMLCIGFHECLSLKEMVEHTTNLIRRDRLLKRVKQLLPTNWYPWNAAGPFFKARPAGNLTKSMVLKWLREAGVHQDDDELWQSAKTRVDQTFRLGEAGGATGGLAKNNTQMVRESYRRLHLVKHEESDYSVLCPDVDDGSDESSDTSIDDSQQGGLSFFDTTSAEGSTESDRSAGGKAGRADAPWTGYNRVEHGKYLTVLV